MHFPMPPPGGAEGMLNTNGGRFGGYGLYLLKGKPVFTYVQLTEHHPARRNHRGLREHVGLHDQQWS
jgi:hypothetical protein